MNRILIDLAWEAQLHKETYSAVIQGALRTPGAKKSFAERVDISPQYLSYLLDADDPRTPGPEVAKKIAAALPVDAEYRARLLEDLILANQRRLEQISPFPEGSSTPLLAERVAMLARAHHLASISTDAQRSRLQYLAVRSAAKTLLAQVNPRVAAVEAIQICFVIHDTQCLLNRHDDALYHAKLARVFLHYVDSSTQRKQREYLDWLELHAMRAESVAYHNLKVPQKSLACNQEAETSRAMRQRPEESAPHLLRDKLNIISHLPRFALREAEELAHYVRNTCQQRAAHMDPIWEFLMQRSLGRAYLKYGNLRKASRVLDTLLTDTHRIPHLDPIHKTVFLTTYTTLLWQQKHAPNWQEALDLAITEIDDSRVNRPFAEMREKNGPAMGPSLQDLRLLPTSEAAELASPLTGERESHIITVKSD